MPPSDADKLNTTMRNMVRELNRLGNVLEAVNKNLVKFGRMMQEEQERRKAGHTHWPPPDFEGLGFKTDPGDSGIIVPKLPEERNPYPFGTVNHMRWAAGIRDPAPLPQLSSTPPEDPNEGEIWVQPKG